ncbi:hypothetical protein AbraIFM66950_010554, partial [Aspergillus brasiliensis]
MTVDDDDPVRIWRPYLQKLPAHHDASLINLVNLESQLLKLNPRVLTSSNEVRVRVTDFYD